MQTTVAPEWLRQVLDVTKLVLPWFTGGLAGAILTYLLNQRLQRRHRARLSVSTDHVDFTIGSHDDTFKDLRVSYAGRSFQMLLLFDMVVTNVATKTISRCPVLLTLGSRAEIVETKSSLRPVNREIHLVPQPNEPGAFIWDPGELKPQDSGRLRLLVTSSSALDWTFRGDDDVEVIAGTTAAVAWLDAEARFLLLFVSAWVFFGAFPIIGGMLQAFLLITAAPVVVRFLRRMHLAASTSWRKSPAPSVEISGADAELRLVYDSVSGASTIDVSTSRRETPE